MKKIKFQLLLCTILLTFVACIYESDVAIDQPSVKVSPKLLYSWEDLTNHAIYKIKSVDDYTYEIEVMHKDEKKADKLNAYASIVDGKTFLNVWDATKKASRSYQFYKFKFLSDTLMEIHPLTANIREKFTSSSDLKSFISSNMDHSFFYEPEIQFKRLKNK